MGLHLPCATVETSQDLTQEQRLGLTVDEGAALLLYNTEGDPKESIFYHIVNAVLRDRDRTKVEPFKNYLRLFYSAYTKLPPFKGTIYRGVNENLIERFSKDKPTTWWANFQLFQVR